MSIIFLLGSLMFGVVLGQLFRVFVLFPTSVLVAILVFGWFLLQGRETLHALLETGAIVVVMQMGYMLGYLPHLLPCMCRLSCIHRNGTGH